MIRETLDWTLQDRSFGNWREARLDNPDGTVGVLFSLSYQPTCHRRGKWKLLVDVQPGPYHHAWGCFDAQDQPMRLYHSEATALSEAQLLANVLTDGFEPANAGKERDPFAAMVNAPWSADQVASLNGYQVAGVMHPFTGVNAAGEKVDLFATPEGWKAEVAGEIVQTWAHPWMANWSWVIQWLANGGGKRLRKAYETLKETDGG